VRREMKLMCQQNQSAFSTHHATTHCLHPGNIRHKRQVKAQRYRRLYRISARVPQKAEAVVGPAQVFVGCAVEHLESKVKTGVVVRGEGKGRGGGGGGGSSTMTLTMLSSCPVQRMEGSTCTGSWNCARPLSSAMMLAPWS
jgi:hypothetical protein